MVHDPMDVPDPAISQHEDYLIEFGGPVVSLEQDLLQRLQNLCATEIGLEVLYRLNSG